MFSHRVDRRAVLRSLSLPAMAPWSQAIRASRPQDIRIVEAAHAFEEHRYRAPYQFGGRTVDRVTILNVHLRVRTGAGKEAWGFGSMPLGNAWAYPGVPYDASLGAMTALAGELRRHTAACDESGHPIDLFRVLELQHVSEEPQERAPGPVST